MLIPTEPKMMFLFFVAIFVVLFVIANYFLPFNKTPVTLISGRKEVNVIAEIADNPISQAKGLMFRESLKENEGMIFIFSGNEKRTFWMKNTLIPLDIIFVSSDMTIVDIKENFEPCQEFSCPSYTSKAGAKYVLEVNAGFVKKHNIKIGDRMRFR